LEFRTILYTILYTRLFTTISGYIAGYLEFAASGKVMQYGNSTVETPVRVNMGVAVGIVLSIS